MPRTVATHQQPDAAALVAAWLAYRFMFPSEVVSVEFVSRSFIPSSECPYDCVVDVGCQYDPFRLHFDHKPPAVADRHSSCASRMVWEYLLARGDDAAHLAGLIDAVHDGDSSKRRNGSLAYRQSQKDGLHAFIKTQHVLSDEEMLGAVSAWLDKTYISGHARGHSHDESRWQSYGRGRVYLYCLESGDETLQCRTILTEQAYRRLKFATWDKKWRTADQLGVNWGNDRKAIWSEAEFTLAVDRIVHSCGDSIRSEILSGALFKCRKDIMQVGRREPERRRFAVGQVRLGKPPMKERPLGIFDTANFTKVITRLGRAEGKLRVCISMLKAGHKEKKIREGDGKWLKKIESQKSSIESNLPMLRDALIAVPTQPSGGNQRSSQKKEKKEDPELKFNLGLLNTFASILISNLPLLPDRIRPTAEQKERTLECLQRIEVLFRELCTAWDGVCG